MNIRGRIRNGVVELEGEVSLPDGTEVVVSCPDAPSGGVKGAAPTRKGRRLALPLVPSRRPGSVDVTAERIAELLDEADVRA